MPTDQLNQDHCSLPLSSKKDATRCTTAVIKTLFLILAHMDDLPTFTNVPYLLFFTFRYLFLDLSINVETDR